MSGDVSAGIEPWAANIFTEQTAKGTFIRKNPELERVLKKIGKNTKEVWDKILEDGGSVQDLEFLEEWVFIDGKIVELATVTDQLQRDKAYSIKDVFKTFGEISQKEVVIQAAQRQKYIDQSQSLNLMIPHDAKPKDVNELLIFGWEQGVKTFYYQKSTSPAQKLARNILTCKSCEG